MKKIISFSLIVILILICITGKVYAKPSCNISITANKAEVEKKDTVTFDVNLSNIQSENGIIAIQAILEYDSSMLTLGDMVRTK